MKKRAVAAVLWFYAGWYAFQLVAYFAGFPGGGDVIGPVVGAAIALLIAVDPRRTIWSKRTKAQAAESSLPAPTTA